MLWWEGGTSLCAAALAAPSASTSELLSLTETDLGSPLYAAANAMVSRCRVTLNATSADGRRAMHATALDFAGTLRPVTDATIAGLSNDLVACSKQIGTVDMQAQLSLVRQLLTDGVGIARAASASSGGVLGGIKALPVIVDANVLSVRLLTTTDSSLSAEASNMETRLFVWLYSLSALQYLQAASVILFMEPPAPAGLSVPESVAQLTLHPFYFLMHMSSVSSVTGTLHMNVLSAQRYLAHLQGELAAAPGQFEVLQRGLDGIYNDTQLLFLAVPLAGSSQLAFQSLYAAGSPTRGSPPLLVKRFAEQGAALRRLTELSADGLVTLADDAYAHAALLLFFAVLCTAVTMLAVAGMAWTVHARTQAGRSRAEAQSRTRFLRALMHGASWPPRLRELVASGGMVAARCLCVLEPSCGTPAPNTVPTPNLDPPPTE